MAEISWSLVQSNWTTETDKLCDFIRSGKQLTMGENVKEFERRFAEYHGKKHAIMVNSGSSANLIGVAALVESGKLSAGSYVMVPALGWSTTYYPLVQWKLDPVMIDIDPETLNIDPKEVEKYIQFCIKTRREMPKAMMVVNVLGNPCDYKALNDICVKYDLILIEDNCESFGAKYDGKYAGTFGVVGTFSFHFSHHLQTIEGGMIVTDDDVLVDYCKSLRNHGWSRDLAIDNAFGKKPDDEFYNKFDFVSLGYNVRPMEIQGVLGNVQLEKIEEVLENFKNNGKLFDGLFDCEEMIDRGITVQRVTENGESSYFGFVIIADGVRMTRERLLGEMNILGIETRPVIAGNFLKQPISRRYGFPAGGPLENVDFVHNNGLFIGNNPFDYSDRIRSLCDHLKGLK